jgi:hypothetical protein
MDSHVLSNLANATVVPIWMFKGGTNKFSLVINSLNETQEPIHAVFFEVYETTSLCLAWVHGATIAVIVQLLVCTFIYVLSFAWSHRSNPLTVSTGRVFRDTSITSVKFVNLMDRQKFVNPWRCRLFLFMKKGYNIHNWVALYHLICFCLSTKHSYRKEEMKSIGKFVIDKLLSYMLLMVQQTSEGLVTLLQVRACHSFPACFITESYSILDPGSVCRYNSH